MKLRKLSGFIAAALTFGFLPRASSGQQVEYYHLDALGSVRGVTDESGAIVVRHDYYPYGEEWNEPASKDSRRFTGKERDDESGLDYFGARYYGSKTARFVSVDPVITWEENLADPQRWNRFQYARANPLAFLDPTGEKIELVGTETQRAILLDAIRQGLPEEARSRVFQREVGEAGALRFYVGLDLDSSAPGGRQVFTEGVGAVLANLVFDSRTVEFGLSSRPGLVVNSVSPGASEGRKDGSFRVQILDPAFPYRPLPGGRMSDGNPGAIDPGLVTMHEFAHAASRMGLIIPAAMGSRRVAGTVSDDAALFVENLVRVGRSPEAATRKVH